MNDRSYVAMGQHMCPVCCGVHDSGEILMHKRLLPVLEKKTVTGWSMCPEHQKLKDDDYVAFVETEPPGAGTVTPRDARRTGKVMHMRREVAKHFFDIPLDGHDLVFVEPGVIDHFADMVDKPLHETGDAGDTSEASH